MPIVQIYFKYSFFFVECIKPFYMKYINMIMVLMIEKAFFLYKVGDHSRG